MNVGRRHDLIVLYEHCTISTLRSRDLIKIGERTQHPDLAAALSAALFVKISGAWPRPLV